MPPNGFVILSNKYKCHLMDFESFNYHLLVFDYFKISPTDIRIFSQCHRGVRHSRFKCFLNRFFDTSRIKQNSLKNIVILHLFQTFGVLTFGAYSRSIAITFKTLVGILYFARLCFACGFALYGVSMIYLPLSGGGIRSVLLALSVL